MSRILRRPMFRGGRVSSYGTGIAHGLADGGMPPKRGLVTGPGGYAGDWNWKGGSSGNITTGGQIVDKAAKTLESRIAKGVRGAGRWLRNPGTGISGWAMRNFPTAMRWGAHGLPVYGALKGSGAQLELIDKASEKGMLDEFGENVEFVDGRILPSDEFMETVDPSEYTVESGVFEEETEPVTGIEGPPGDGDPDMFYKEREVGNETGEPLELTAKEMIKENKKLFADLLGADKARGQDISDMLIGASAKLLKPDATVRSGLSEFMEAESKRPGKLEKINETAAALAINDYIAGKRSKESLDNLLAKTKFGVDYQIAAGTAMSDLSKKDWSDSLLTVFNEYKGREDIRGTKVIGDTLYRKFKKPVQVLAKYGKKSKEDIMEDKADDFIEGFNIVIHKNGKSIIEKVGEQLIDRSDVLPI